MHFKAQRRNSPAGGPGTLVFHMRNRYQPADAGKTYQTAFDVHSLSVQLSFAAPSPPRTNLHQ
jgi:hypothetical protein